jgi:hypothetical protein
MGWEWGVSRGRALVWDSLHGTSPHPARMHGMDFGLQYTIPGTVLPTEWQTLLSEQARALDIILTRLAETVTRATTQPNRAPALAARLYTLLTEAEQLLVAMARQNIGFEHETAHVQASQAAAVSPAPETTTRLQAIDHVNTALHANLTAARQYLTDLRHNMERSISTR